MKIKLFSLKCGVQICVWDCSCYTQLVYVCYLSFLYVKVTADYRQVYDMDINIL